MSAPLLPAAVESALQVLEISTDLAAGEDAFWTVQRFQNTFGVQLALPNVVFSTVVGALALTAYQVGWSNPAMIAVMIGATLIVVSFVYLTRARAKAAHAANTRMTAALRRWRTLAEASASKKGQA